MNMKTTTEKLAYARAALPDLDETDKRLDQATRPLQHFKTTKLKSGFFRCRIVETGYYGHGSTPGEARLSALRLQNGNEPTRPPEQPKITLDMFEGQEIPFNLHGPIREMVKQLEAKDWAQDQLVEIYGNALAKITAQRDELLATLKGVFDIVENEIGYRLDSEFPHERKYAQSMIDARTALSKCEAQP